VRDALAELLTKVAEEKKKKTKVAEGRMEKRLFSVRPKNVYLAKRN
jgi:hypothetical protein